VTDPQLDPSISRYATVLDGIFRDVRNEHARRRGAIRSASTTPFATWAGSGGFIVDREPFSLDVWRYLRPIYEAIPAERTGFDVTIMKSAQGGASTLCLLMSIWLSLRGRIQTGYFLPTETMAALFSSTRFLPLVRANSEIHRTMSGSAHSTSRSAIDEGSAAMRRIGDSIIHFAYMSGVISTEALPLDALILDEVQEMLLADIQKVEERLSASDLRAILRVSTANFAGSDIHHFFQESDQREFHTACGCVDGLVLSDAWDPNEGPQCIDRGNGTSPGVPTTWFFVCPRCTRIIDDPQEGRFIPHNPSAETVGFHFSQLLSPRQTAAWIRAKWERRIDTKAFYNRVLGLPYTDPSSQPISLTHLQAAQRQHLRWGPLEDVDGSRVLMGIDHRGHENHVVVKADCHGQVRLLWLEVVQDEDPWRRCVHLMEEFSVDTCVVEANPNYNEAHRFARRFGDRVFVASYQELADELVAWKDRPGTPSSARRTTDDARSPHAVAIDQHRMMSWSLGRWKEGEIETPDARSRIQEIRTSHGRQSVSLCSDLFWKHMQSVLLVIEPLEGRADEHRHRRRVKKIAIDPHFAFANMLADVALIREDTTCHLISDESQTTSTGRRSADMAQIADAFPLVRGVVDPDLCCGTCVYRDPSTGKCRLRLFSVQPDLPMCDEYIPLLEDDV